MGALSFIDSSLTWAPAYDSQPAGVPAAAIAVPIAAGAAAAAAVAAALLLRRWVPGMRERGR